jgi:hypothetical protein
MTPEPTVQDEASYRNDSPADGIQGDYADQQEREHHQRCAALPVAVRPCDRNSGNADQKRYGEDHPARLGEPKPVSEPSPVASEPRHASSLGQSNSKISLGFRAREACAREARPRSGPDLERPGPDVVR